MGMGEERIQKHPPVANTDSGKCLHNPCFCGLIGEYEDAVSPRLSPRQAYSVECVSHAPVAKLVKAGHSKCSAETLPGSSPGGGTKSQLPPLDPITSMAAWLAIIVVALIMLALVVQHAEARTPTTITKGCGKHVHVLDRRACIIRRVFGRKQGRTAVRVAFCESRLDPRATNGQYRGVFQMGRAERARFGHGRTVVEQARAAKAYFDVAGWRPWSCA